jgi:integrase
MTYRFTVLIDVPQELLKICYQEREADHESILGAYLRTFEKRAFDEKTTNRTKIFLNSVFERILVGQPEGGCQRHLLISDLLNPVGAEIIDLFVSSISKHEYSRTTQMKYLGEIRRLCDFVIQRPYIPGRSVVSITQKYGAPCQPVSRYDYPSHAVEDPDVDPALIDDALRKFLDFVRVHYLSRQRKKDVARRNYAMVVIGVTSGVRANELAHLDVDDLRYDENRIWVRFGKGHRGSGKRHRVTLFTKFGQETIRVYLNHTRPGLEAPNKDSRALFLTSGGKRITYGAMRYALGRIIDLAREAGLEIPEPFTWHDTRRTFATGNLHKRPGDVLRVSAYMGHTGLGTLHRYIRPHRKSLRQATKNVIARVSPQQ